MRLEEIGILMALPKVELAKVVGEAEEVDLQAGESLEPRDSVFFICAGTISVQSIEDELSPLTLREAVAGDVIGEWPMAGEFSGPARIVASTDSTLYRIPSARWIAVLDRNPSINQMVQAKTLQRLQLAQQSLAKYNRYLDSYMNGLWTTSDHPDQDEAAAMQEDTTEESPPLNEIPPANTGFFHSVTKLFPATISLLSLAVTGVLWLIPGLGTSPSTQASFILVWATLNWLLNIIPDYVVALAACLFAVVVGVTSAGQAFGGFADPTWFLLLGAFGIGAVVQKSGLLYRAALHLLRILPPTYPGQSFALAVTGVLLTPCLPSVNSRVAIAGPLAVELSEAMRFSQGSKGAAGLAMSAFMGFGQMRFLFLNGSSNSLLAWGLLPLMVRKSAHWLEWLWVALPLGLLVFFVTQWVVIYWLFSDRGVKISQSVISRQLAILGGLSHREKTTMWMALGVLAGFVLEPVHHIDPSWIGLSGFLLAVLLGGMEKDQLIKSIDWPYMLFYGAITGMVVLIDKSDLSKWLVQQILDLITPSVTFAQALPLVVALLTLLLRLLLQPAPAIAMMSVAFFPISASVGYNPLIIAVSIVTASTTWIVPQLMASYSAFYSATQGKCYNHRQVRPLSLIHALLILFGIAICIPLWSLLGLSVVN